MVLLLVERLDEQALLLIFQLLPPSALTKLGAVNKALRALLVQESQCSQALWKALCIRDFRDCCGSARDAGKRAGLWRPLISEAALDAGAVPCVCGRRGPEGGALCMSSESVENGAGRQEPGGLGVDGAMAEHCAMGPEEVDAWFGGRCRCGAGGGGGGAVSAGTQDGLGLAQLKCWGQRYARLHSIFSIKRVAWSQPISLAGRNSVGARQGAAGDVVWENLVVFGGWDSSNRICCDVQMLLLQRAGCRWERLAVHGLLPRAVYGSTLTRIECEDYGECALVFGGVLHGGYRGATAQWAVLRQQHAVAATTAPSLYTPPPTFLYPNTPTTVAWGDGGQVSVGAHQSFSGAGGGGAVRDYNNASECEYEWVYPQSEDGANQRQQPTARAYHTATFDARLGVVFVFGGFANGRPLSRLQVLQVGRGQGALLDTWTWWSPTISGLDPPPRYGHSASLVGRDLIIAGGCSGGHNHKGMASGGADLFDIFILKVGESLSDELAWTQVALPDAAPFRGLQRCHSSFVAGHKVIFAFGGPSHAMTNQVRSFDVCTQTFDPAPTLLGNPPRARQGAVLAKVCVFDREHILYVRTHSVLAKVCVFNKP